jgi:hypothetical protein
VPYLADADAGYIWRLNGTFDGLPTTVSDGRITAAAGSTTTILNTNESMPTSPQDLVGSIFYDPAYGTEHRITANTANTITLNTALSATPTLNQKYYIGSIDIRLVPQWTSGRDLCNHIRPSYLLMEHIGTDEVEYTLQYNVDFQTSGTTLSSDLSDDRLPSGITFKDTSTFYITNLNQHMSVPVPSEWHHVIRYNIHQLEPYGDVRILGLTFQNDPGTVIDPITRE